MINVINGAKISYEKLIGILLNDIPVSDTANFINGYSYTNISNGIKIYTPVKALHNTITPLRRFIYLPNYNTELGIIKNIPSKERVICDFLMYPKELSANLYLLDALEGYEEEFGSFDNIYALMDILKIPHILLNNWLPRMWSGGNYGALD